MIQIVPNTKVGHRKTCLDGTPTILKFPFVLERFKNGIPNSGLKYEDGN